MERETFKTDESWNINNVDFIIPPGDEHVVYYNTVNNNNSSEALACLCVTDAGNAYAQVLSTPGAAFEKPINTSAHGEAPTYRVAPYIGVVWPVRETGSGCVFMTWITSVSWAGNRGYVDFLMQVWNPIRDKEGLCSLSRRGWIWCTWRVLVIPTGWFMPYCRMPGGNVVFTGSICRVTGMFGINV